jgi:UDP-N-acetylglucosamine 4,6-dehydratase
MRDKVVLVTGGCGSFGKEFIRDILTKDPRQVRVFSRDEFKQAQMKEEFKDPRIEYLCGDVRDAERLNMALEGVDVCVHAAAMKRIEKCELDPQEAIKTNVEGSINVANACLKQNVSHAILISTDKACYPVNLYGATKLVAEKVWIQSNTYRGRQHPTKFSVVRYGNVLGSRGSVLHIFRDQLDKGVIKVTDQRMTRFFITLQEAVDLVQLAIEIHQGGEIFIPQLKAASIYRLAQMVAGAAPIEVSTQRGGEKLHETLVTMEEKERLATYDHFNVVNPEKVSISWPYEMWHSEGHSGYVTSSEFADQFTDEELQSLLELAPVSNP